MYCPRIRGRHGLALGSGVLVALSLVTAGSSAISARPVAAPAPASAIRFTQLPRRNLLRITAPGYELTLSRTNGAIVSVVDRAARTKLVVGQGGCIWGARADGSGDYIGGCSFSRTGVSRFSYRWDARTAKLTLKYTANPTAPDRISATAVLSASATYFDLAVTVENHLHRTLSSVLVPADLLGVSGNVTAGYSPNFLPGIRLGPSFFKGTRGDVLTYPGRWA